MLYIETDTACMLLCQWNLSALDMTGLSLAYTCAVKLKYMSAEERHVHFTDRLTEDDLVEYSTGKETNQEHYRTFS